MVALEMNNINTIEQLGNPYSRQYVFDLRRKSSWYSLIRRHPGGLLIVDSVFKIKRDDIVLLHTGKRDAVLQVVGTRIVIKRKSRDQMSRYELRTEKIALSRTLVWVFKTKDIKL